MNENRSQHKEVEKQINTIKPKCKSNFSYLRKGNLHSSNNSKCNINILPGSVHSEFSMETNLIDALMVVFKEIENKRI